MKKVGVIFIGLILIFVLACGCKSQKSGEKPSKVLATVNGEKITEAEFNAQMEGKPDFYKQYAQSPDGKRQLLDKLIEKKLLLQTAKKEGILDSPDIEAKVQEYRERIIIDKLREKIAPTKIEVSEEEVKNYYEQNRSQFDHPDSVRLKQIVLEDRKTANDIYKQLKTNPRAFDELARTHSKDNATKDKGGEMGFVERGSLAPELDSVVFNMNVGEISPVLASGNKFYIFQVLQKRPGEHKTFEQVKDMLKRRLEFEQKQNSWKDYVDNLKKTAEIKIEP